MLGIWYAFSNIAAFHTQGFQENNPHDFVDQNSICLLSLLFNGACQQISRISVHLDQYLQAQAGSFVLHFQRHSYISQGEKM